MEMRALKAHIENGRIVADEPVNLPDGTLLRVVPVESVDEQMSAEERAALEQSIEDGYAEFDRGEYDDAEEFAARLLSKP
jgi:hypothetical protein